MQLLAVAILALAAEGSDELHAPNRVVPPSAPSAFNPLPEMWGLRALSRQARLEELDEAFVLYLTERARFTIVGQGGRVFLSGGRQLVASQLSEAEIADDVSIYSCLCALEYEPPMPAGDFHAPAGAYRVTEAPSRTTAESGIVTVEFQFSHEGQAEGTTLRRLVCWTSTDDSLAPLAAALPGFATLARKEHPGFVDPPVDAREVPEHDRAPDIRNPDRILAFLDGDIPFQRGRGREPLPLDAPELVGVAKPGLWTLWREVQSGRKLTVDHSDYYFDTNRSMLFLNRRLGIHSRDPGCWP